MTYLVGAMMMAFCGLVGLCFGDRAHAAEVCVAIAALLIIGAEFCIFVERSR